jgi:hypothetical protein
MTSSSVLSSCVALEWHPLVPPRVRQVAPVLSAAALCEASVSSLRERKEKKRRVSLSSLFLSPPVRDLLCALRRLFCALRRPLVPSLGALSLLEGAVGNREAL